MAVSFIIYRILGNALPPRHGRDDTCNNLRFILEHEPALPGCEKRWLLNRLLDKHTEQKCVDLIKAHGQRYDTIAFDPLAYQDTFLDPTGMPLTLNPFTAPESVQTTTQALKGMGPLAAEWILRHKSQVLININAARNHALLLGRSEATWTLPLDGGCFFTRQSWSFFVQGLASADDALYAIIPMARINANSQLSDPAWRPDLIEEPQIAFRRDAPDRFNEAMRYGNRNKVELLVRLGIPGRWQMFRPAPWDNAPTPTLKAKGRAVTCGWICRLATSAEGNVEKNGDTRFAARLAGVHRLAQEADTARLRLARQTNSLPPLHTSDRTAAALNAQLTHLLGKPLGKISDKTTQPPSGNPNDYFSIPRYLHMLDGRPHYIDGQSNPAAIIGSLESRRYDRTSFYECIRNISILTAAGLVNNREDALLQAAKILDCWFINEKTRMNPHARFAQFDPRLPQQANFAGLIDLRDLWVLPQLCERLHAANALSKEQYEAIRQWAGALSNYLARSQQGQTAFKAPNNIGTWTHLLKASMAYFSGQDQAAAFFMAQASLRLAAQQEPTGRQPRELARTRPLHYAFFNLTAWVLFANFGRRLGINLWKFCGAEGQSICTMMKAVQADLKNFPEYRKTPEHFSNWLSALHQLTPDDAANRALLGLLPQPVPTRQTQWRDDPDTGLPPQWAIFLLPTVDHTAPQSVV